MVYNTTSLAKALYPSEVPPLLHKVMADIKFILPEGFVLSRYPDDYWSDGEGRFVDRVFVEHAALQRPIVSWADVPAWRSPVQITVYCHGMYAESASIDITQDADVVLSVAGYPDAWHYRESVLAHIEKKLEEVVGRE